MNKFKLIIFSLILLVVTVGVVSAATITDYNGPVGFDRNPVTFSHDGFEMDMKSYSTFMDHDDYFKNSSDREVKIINGTYAEYKDSMKDNVGAVEILKIDDEQYLIYCSFDGADKNKTADCLKYLEEFNEVNKFKPIKIDDAS